MAARSCTRRAATVLPTERHDGPFHRRRAGGARSDHGARPAPGAWPVVLYAGSLVPRSDRPGRQDTPVTRIIDTAPLDWTRSSARWRRGLRASRSRGCIRATRRSTARSASRCAACAARHSLRRHPGRAGVRRRRGRAPAGADAAGRRPVGGADPDGGARLADARWRDPGGVRGDRRHARDPPVDQQSGAGGARADAGLRRRLPDRRPGPTSASSAAPWPRSGRMRGQEITRTALILVERGADDSRLYAPDHHHVLRPASARWRPLEPGQRRFDRGRPPGPRRRRSPDHDHRQSQFRAAPAWRRSRRRRSPWSPARRSCVRSSASSSATANGPRPASHCRAVAPAARSMRTRNHRSSRRMR